MAKKNQVTIRGKTYNLDDAADVVSIQNALVPENWKLRKADAVRLFVSLQNMAALQFKRHFAANFKGLLKAALEEGEDSGAAKIGAAYAFEIDVTAPQVAALTKLKMSYSVKHGTDGKPQTHDLTQGEFLDENDEVVLDASSLETEKAEAAAEEKKQKDAEAKAAKEEAKAKATPKIDKRPPAEKK